MATLILNIGLNVEGGERLTLDTVVDAVEAVGVFITAAEVQQSDTEATAVLTLDPVVGKFRNAGIIYYLARALRQEAIAFASVLNGQFDYGDIVGPAAANWGDFDPSRFLLPEAHKDLFA